MRKRSMMDTGVVTSADHGGVAPERLQLLAKKASSLHTDRGVALTDAVATTLDPEPGLNEEHVRRVTEMANTYAFQTLFKRASDGHRVINFEGGPADAAAVVQELRTTGTGPAVTKIATQAVVRDSERYAPGLDSFQRAVDQTQRVKTAQARPNTDQVFRLANDLHYAKEALSTEVVSSRVQFDDASRSLHKAAQTLVKEGHSPAEIGRIVADRCAEPLAKLALRTIYGLGGWDNIEATPRSKTATAWINPQHPFVVRLDEFTKLATDHFAKLRALELVVEQDEAARFLLKEALS